MAKKRKVLPDLRPRIYSYPDQPDDTSRRDSPPSPEKIQKIAARHGFPVGFDLVEKLEDRWVFYHADVYSGAPPSGAVRRKFLRELADRAALLEDAITKAGNVERKLILDSIPSGRLDFDGLERGARELALAARVAEGNVPRSRRGARGNPETIELLCKLWRVYRAAFGDNAARLSRTGTRYGGRFFDFANDVLHLFGIRKSNDGLGKAIQKAQAAVAARDSDLGMP